MEALSPWHLLIVAGVALVLFFGWKQLPDMTRSLGRSLRIFRTEIKGLNEDHAVTPDQPASATVRPLPFRNDAA